MYIKKMFASFLLRHLSIHVTKSSPEKPTCVPSINTLRFIYRVGCCFQFCYRVEPKLKTLSKPNIDNLAIIYF